MNTHFCLSSVFGTAEGRASLHIERTASPSPVGRFEERGDEAWTLLLTRSQFYRSREDGQMSSARSPMLLQFERIDHARPSAYPARVAFIEPEHAQFITDHAVAHLRRLNGLCERLQANRIPMDDPLMRAAFEARNAVHALRVQSMYAAMEQGVGEPATPP